MRLIPQLLSARWGCCLAGALLVGVTGLGPKAQAAAIREPATVFYGRILGTGSERPFVVTTGELRWTLRRADGRELTLRTGLFPLRGGDFSYRLNVPHEALALGVTASSGTVPLGGALQTHEHLQITVNGMNATIRGPAGAQFEAAQARRAATYRLDLEVPLVAEDSDGDGLPDWWEQLHGADLDPDGDVDGDGRKNLAEFRAETDPQRDDRRPKVLTRELRAYAEATTGVRLRVVDADTPPDRLVYTLVQVPEGARLLLRNARENPTAPDVVLEPGDHFTQQQILEGRVVLEPQGASPVPTRFTLSLTDGTAEHAAETAMVQVTFYQAPESLRNRPAAGELLALAHGAEALPGVEAFEEQSARNQLLGKAWGCVVWDGADELGEQLLAAPSSWLEATEYLATQVPRFGPERHQLLVGGRGADRLLGGMADDVLLGGGGADRLRGHGGGDRFVFVRGQQGASVIEDFSPSEGDVIDLGRALSGASTRLEDYVRVEHAEGAVVLAVDAGGRGAASIDFRVSLAGVAVGDADLHRWVADGNLVAGSRHLRPRVELAASQAEASEEGPVQGTFRLTRLGSLEAALTVQLAISGSAVNGLDYARLAETATFAPGERELFIAVSPFADSQAEPVESVAMTVLPGEGYEVAAGAQGSRVQIADLPVVIALETLEPVATVEPPLPGVLLVRRSTVLDRSVLVRLEIRGSAAAGVDYLGLPRFVNLAAGQTTALLEVTPRGGASLSGRAPTVEVRVLPDDTYRVESGARGEVTLLSQRVNLAGWRAAAFPGAAGGLEAFAREDPGHLGLSMLQRYAFGMDPRAPELDRRPRVSVRDGHLTLDYWRRAGATDVEYCVETSRDLRTWEASPDGVQELPGAGEVPGGLARPVSVRALPAVGTGEVRFLRLRITYRP